MAADERETPGWNAINLVVDSVYPDQEPRHYAPILPNVFGGRDPINGISAYKSTEGGVSWWHFVTYGFTELYQKESDDPDVSGFGFELTFRLVGDHEAEPPAWAISFLQNLGRYVFSTGNGFDVGHHLNCNGPIALDTETKIRAICFGLDDKFRETTSPNGSFQFLQIVGITLDELDALVAWDGTKFLQAMREVNPLLLTDLTRDSYLADTRFRQLVEEGAARDGSSTGVLYVTELHWQNIGSPANPDLHLTLGANVVKEMLNVLKGRLLFGRELTLYDGKHAATLTSGPCSWSDEFNALQLSLTAEALQEIYDRLEPIQGQYRLDTFPGLVLNVTKFYIRDQDGKVVETIG